jgi:hypothetical protein
VLRAYPCPQQEPNALLVSVSQLVSSVVDTVTHVVNSVVNSIRVAAAIADISSRFINLFTRAL